MSWAQAQSYCANADFRLPTVKELRSIVDFRVAFPGPTIDPNAFPNTPAEGFWTSSPYSPNTTYVWFVKFDNGSSNETNVASNHRVRCVR
jgi:hypothetical protein